MVRLMNKYKRLMGNSIIFAIGNLGSKLMQFIMIPLYSYTLTTSEYGKVDFLTTVISLILPILSVDIFDAVFRYALDKTDNNKVTFNTSILFSLAITVISFIIAILLQLSIHTYPIMYAEYVLVASLFFSLISNYARAVNKIKEFAIAGIINSIAMGLLNFALLYFLNWKMDGYLLSMGSGMLFAVIYIMFACHFWNELDFRSYSWQKLKVMLKYSTPLVPNLLAWWLNSASDRMFILLFIGASANGIYAMASKIPNILSTLMTIFLQSWQISVVEEYDSEHGKRFITNVFQVFTTAVFVIAIGILTFLKPIFHLLVSPAYFIGWQVAPFLLLSIIYSNAASFLGTIYTATKKTVPIMYTTVIGAIVNIILSIVIIPFIGIYGAAIANIFSFALVSFFRFKDIIKANKISIKLGQFILLHILFIIVLLANFLSKNNILPISSGLISLLIIAVIDPNFKRVISIIKSKIS